MTSLLNARDELDAALVAGTIAVADGFSAAAVPCALIYGEGGGDLEHISRAQFTGRFRITLISGAWDQGAAGRILTGLVQQTILVVRGLPGWRVDEVRRDNTIDVAGGRMLGADVVVSRMVDIA